MNLAYQKHLTYAISKKSESKKFFEKLKKNNPTNLDKDCNRLHDEAFEVIDCLQCGNCCKTTGPLLLDKDIARLAKYLKIKPATFTENYLRIDEDKDYVFKKMPCIFLEENNCCSVYENRPNACREYPHTQQSKIIQKLKITFENTLICPAVAKVVEGLKLIYN